MTDVPNPSRDVSAQLVRLMRLIGSIKGQAAARHRHGVEFSSYVLLFQLVMHGPQRSSALAERVHADPSTISRQTTALVELGLVERRPDPADGRAVLLAASTTGEELFARMHRERDAVFATVLADWSAADTATFLSLLDRFNTDFETYRPLVLQRMQQEEHEPDQTGTQENT